MSLPVQAPPIHAWVEILDRLLSRRWVQCALFVSVLLLTWLLGTRTAYA